MPPSTASAAPAPIAAIPGATPPRSRRDPAAIHDADRGNAGRTVHGVDSRTVHGLDSRTVHGVDSRPVHGVDTGRRNYRISAGPAPAPRSQ
ncbi:MAG TPA: hypothetical protein VGD37_42960 [Kofleriaceae bacterium]|jgi:hypothetical protein